MAWNTINYTCGHTEEKQLYGKMTERERKIGWAEKGVCWECQKKENLETAKKESGGRDVI